LEGVAGLFQTPNIGYMVNGVMDEFRGLRIEGYAQSNQSSENDFRSVWESRKWGNVWLDFVSDARLPDWVHDGVMNTC